MGNTLKELFISKKAEPVLMKERVVVEWCENVHVHFRNMRLEFDEDSFLKFASGMFQARNRLWQWHDAPIFKEIPVEQVDPYDAAHQPADNGYGFDCGSDESNAEHERGISCLHAALLQGKPIPPILVKQVAENRYKRLDGFKRYFAIIRNGDATVPCIVDNHSVHGAQEEIEWHSGQLAYTHVPKPADRDPHTSRGERYEILTNYDESAAFPREGRLLIEFVEGGIFHFHYNNVRIELAPFEFIRFLSSFLVAFISFLLSKQGLRFICRQGMLRAIKSCRRILSFRVRGGR